MKIGKVIARQHDGNVFNCRLVVPHGSGQDGDIPGIAHFVEHMAFKGTPSIPLSEFNLLSEKIGIFNAYTGFDKTVFHCTSLLEDSKQALSLLLEMVGKASFPSEEVEKEKGVICEEISSWRNDPRRWYWWNACEHMMGKGACHFQAGSEVDVRRTTREDLVAWRDKSLEGVGLVLCGDLESPHAPTFTAEKEEFSSLPDYPVESSPSDKYFSHQSTQAKVGFMSPGKSYIAECKASFATDVASSVLGGGTHSMLWSIREEMGLCYSVGCAHSSYVSWGLNAITTDLSPENVERAQDAIYQTVQDARVGMYTDEQFEIARKSVARQWAMGYQRSADVARIGDMLFSAPDADWSELMDADKTVADILALSRDDVQREINEAWKDSGNWVVMLPEDVSG